MKGKRKKKKGKNPVFAVVLLLGSVGIAAKSMLGGAAHEPGITPMAGAADPAPMGEVATDVRAEEATRWCDLLAVHGSFDRTKDVRLAFVAFEYPSFWAGSGDAAAEQYGRWSGEDPPLLKLGVVMVSAASRRAVLGGRVVGIGDEVASGRVVAIEASSVVLQWSGRRLTYDLDGDAPREFRAELAQRAAENKDDTTAKPTQGDAQNSQKQEPSK